MLTFQPRCHLLPIGQITVRYSNVQMQNMQQILATHQTGYFCNVSMTEQYQQSCAAKTRYKTLVQKSKMDSVIRKAWKKSPCPTLYSKKQL